MMITHSESRIDYLHSSLYGACLESQQKVTSKRTHMHVTQLLTVGFASSHHPIQSWFVIAIHPFHQLLSFHLFKNSGAYSTCIPKERDVNIAVSMASLSLCPGF